MNRTALLPLALLSCIALAAAGCEPEILLGPASAPQTSRLGISKDGKTLYVALADHDVVRGVDAASGDTVSEVPVDGYPHRLTVLSDGRVAVSAKLSGIASIVDVEGARVEATVDVGAEPYGLIEVDGNLIVAVAGENDLAKINLSDPNRVASRIALGHADPRGLALTPDGKVLVSHFTAGVLSVVRGDEAVGEVDMHLPSKQFFFPNQMDSVTVSTEGDTLAVPHVECNNDPAQFGAAGTDLSGAAPPAVTYYVDGPTGYPAVVPAVSHVDTIDDVILSDEDRSFEASLGQTPEQQGAAAPVVNPLNRALLQDVNMNAPVAIALIDGGQLELVVNRGSGNVMVRRPKLLEGQTSIIGVVDVGVGAEAIQISPDGKTAYVYNAFDDSIHSFAVPAAAAQTSRYEGSRGSGDAFVQRSEPLARIDAQRIHRAEPVLPDNVREGRVMFNAVDDRLTRFGAISCASCHPGGGDDGTTWSFAEGPRESPALWGGILGTEPFHWDQAVPDMAGISMVTIQGRMGGAGLDRTSMNKIGAFLDTIPAPAPARTVQDIASVDRGAAIFFSAESQCTTCHSGPNFTDNLAHNVFTGSGYAVRESMSEFATPVLNGLANSAPYLHDGSARTLRELVDRLVRTNRMGRGSQLSEQDADDLVAFLKTL